MGNFDFVHTTLPAVYEDCARAESYMRSDPRSACVYARRAVELLVGHLYRVMNLADPYRDDLSAHINDGAFKARVGNGIVAKLNLIRKVGNTAAHEVQPIPPNAAFQVIKDLHHVMLWASYNHSPNPAAAPMGARFDIALAKKSAPLSKAEVARLLQMFNDQDEAHKQALAEKEGLLAEQEAEIARLRKEIEAAQATKTAPDDRDYDESATRDAVIDVLLNEVGWPLDQARDREYEVSGMPSASGTGYVDYVLWGADGLPLAVVEAKRTSKSPQVGKQQASLYADCLERKFGRRPVIFYTNGYEHWMWDDAAGYPPRQVRGFYTRDELELLIQRRTTRQPLSAASTNAEIAGRPYQQRAIRAVDAVFDNKNREALLVMATGTGKTRTVVALVDQLMKANWMKRVLFLADRTALVSQAVGAFKEHLPSATTVNLVTEKSTEGRVFVSTYPTMMNLINAVDESGRRFGPGYFDLIIIDEAHRSVYAKYGAIFDYFDSLLVGLTATPKDEVDHNTYRLFHLEDGVPTDAYTLEEAVDAGYLVPPKAISVGTKFLRSGIRYDELTPEEKDQWDLLDWGEDGPPDEVDSEAINRFLFNTDTVDKVLKHLMTQGHTVEGGDRLGKTIIFAKSRRHAEFIGERFDINYPQYAGQFARVITHGTPYAESLIDSFKQVDKAPHIAISVDMLDTGIDVPEVVNLVFFKMVRAKSKFWQMIGRGTRLCPNLYGPGHDKKDFFVFDFCGNLEFFSQDLPGSEGQTQKSLSHRIFEARVALIRGLAVAEDPAERTLRDDTAVTLREIVAGMNLDNFVVRPHRRAVERFAEPDAWESLSAEDAEQLDAIAGLPSTVGDADEQAKRFDILILRRQLAQLDGDTSTAERIRETVQAIAAQLKGMDAIPSVKQQMELLESVAGDEWWIDVTLPMLELARLRIRGLVNLIRREPANPIYSTFTDTMIDGVVVDLPGVTPGTNLERFRSKAEAYLKANVDHVALQRLRRNKQLTADDLTSLEAMLIDSGVGDQGDLTWASSQPGGLGIFIRGLVGLDRGAASDAFAEFLDGSRFSVEQIRFVDLIIDELTKNGVMEPGRLFESPYIDNASDGVAGVFDDNGVDGILAVLQSVRESALVAAS
ncbi:DEAD/DEAH box helicase family protein [Gordonia sp. (in: high G+C Gram-positive bacteria)]|uniref:DEAD/DEAH box helicase family protein n=1 Tax=Gordonia sp. (in: high G+C Gram-positive bacteria) TaxID=84139 RepID=UPI0016950D84|nr:DEAD/DEAH box helicase family protein [Gordonia sp. (in: high G+C Gram-positive bacteria)]NLG45847.1 DEAD/DEAH box helicase family protein [Gordonia sp. (in: high G+C Gram-positive bacteria)]